MAKLFETTQVDVSVDSLSLVDFPPMSKEIANIIDKALTKPVELGLIPDNTAKRILAQLWRVMLSALNVESVNDLTSDEAFGVEEESTEMTVALAAIKQKWIEGRVSDEDLIEALLFERIAYSVGEDGEA